MTFESVFYQIKLTKIELGSRMNLHTDGNGKNNTPILSYKLKQHKETREELGGTVHADEPNKEHASIGTG